MERDIQKVLLTEEQIRAKVKELGAQLMEDYGDKNPVFVGVLKGVAVFFAVAFVKELEYDGKIDCPCHSGSYDLRFCKEGIQVFCPECGASHIFDTRAESATADYVNIDSLNLK